MHFCSQEKEIGARLFSRRKKLVLYWPQEYETVAILTSGEGNMCSTVFRRSELVLY